MPRCHCIRMDLQRIDRHYDAQGRLSGCPNQKSSHGQHTLLLSTRGSLQGWVHVCSV